MAVNADVALAYEVAKYYADPLGFVLMAYPWGVKGGPLEQYPGPDVWQADFLKRLGQHVRERKFNGKDPVLPIRMSRASGHGIGKSTIVAWIVDWIMSTRGGARGTITANTFPQLRTKTWPAIVTWTQRCITSRWFVTTDGGRMYRRGHPNDWACHAQTCKIENSESFAGQQAAESTSFFIFDEASGVHDKIWEVAEGGLSSGEPMLFAFGNPTRNTGQFYRANFGSDRDLGTWDAGSIDSRECSFPNHALHEQWIEKYGIDSDYVRVRVRGLPPSASELQYIDADRVFGAQKRQVETLHDEPLIAGFDVSGGGEAWNVIRFRRGRDARSIPPVRISGQTGRDREVLITRAAEVMRQEYAGQKVRVMFVDSAFGSPIVERLHVLGFRNVIEVNFGGHSPDIHQENQRAYMWTQMKDWLPKGAIDSSDVLEIGLTGPGYHLNKSNKLVLESKEDMAARGEASPDDADALALTWAQPVAPVKKPASGEHRPGGGGAMPHAQGWMA